MDRAGRSPLHYAAMEDDIEAVASLLRSDAPLNQPDHQGFTPLHLAAQEHSVRAAAALLAAGADVDAVNIFGNSALYVAVFNSRGRGDLIDLLRSYGADPRLPNRSGQTPVGLARLIGSHDVARFFQDVAD